MNDQALDPNFGPFRFHNPETNHLVVVTATLRSLVTGRRKVMVHTPGVRNGFSTFSSMEDAFEALSDQGYVEVDSDFVLPTTGIKPHTYGS